LIDICLKKKHEWDFGKRSGIFSQKRETIMACALTVLVADDEESDVLLLQTALDKAGLAVNLVIARDGQEAVEYLNNYSKPTLVLLDLHMPRMNGFDVLAWVATRPELQDLPVVVFSSSDLDVDTRKARQLGACECWVKPIGIQGLIEIWGDIHSRYLAPPE
jgi:CheY-like chemotaxis protein